MNQKFTLHRALLTVISLLLFTFAQAQTKKISGQVITDDDHSPLPGVTVSIKGTTQGVPTTVDGSYTIQASTGDILVFRFMGYGTQEVTVGQQAVINVTLKPDNKALNEVVVVGYGTQSRKSVTSAIATLDNKVLATAPRANIGSALQGTISGLQVVNSSGAPGATPLIVLRGGASINSPGAPLVVVDGIIRAYNDIPADDIASVDLLKDAASTAIYGARANNGVILITTKQGKSGAAQVTYKFTQGFNQQRQGYNYMNAGDYIYYNRLGNVNSGRTLAQINASRGYGLLTDAANLASFDIRAETSANQDLLSQGWQDMEDPANPGNRILYKDHSKEVQNLLFRNTRTQDHYLSAMGGNDKGKYFVSLDYYNEDGVIVGSNYNRYSGNFNGSYKVKPNVEVFTGVTLSTASQLGAPAGDVNSLYRTLALWPTFNPWLDAEKTQPNPGNSISDGNPLYWLGKLKRSNEVDRITANTAVKWDITPNLFLKVSGSGYLNQQINQSFQQATQTYATLFANPPSYASTSRESIAGYSRTFQQTYNAILNYTKSFGKHDISAMIGAEYYDQKALTIQVDGTNAPTDNISTANASTIFAVNNNVFGVSGNYSNQAENRIISTFTRLNYTYDDKYLLNFVLREDGVSQLASKNRIGYFPGVSAGWNVTKEAFFENWGLNKIFSTFKPRASYGVNGNIAGLGNYDVQGIYAAQTLYNGQGSFLNTGLTNANLRWEKSRTIDIGADLGFFNDRVSVLFDYYSRNTSDLLTSLPLPSYTGFSSIQTNLGTLQNKGYEFTIKANVLNKPNGLRIDIGATASYVKNKVLKLPYNGNENNRQGGLQVYDPKSGKVIWVGGIQEGQPLGQIYGYKQVSVFKDAAEVAAVAGSRVDNVAGITGPNLPAAGKGGRITPGDVNWQDVDKNDTIDSRDQVYLGNIYPKWTGGFNLNISYKSLSFYSRFEYVIGNTIYNDLVARTLGNYQGTFNYIDLQKQAWSPTNTDTDIPKVYYADQVVGSKQNYTRGNNANGVLNGNNSNFYESGNYLACREITLSYDFSKSLLDKTKFLSKVRVFASGENLFYFKKFSGPTPEAPILNGAITGVYQGTYPTAKTFVVGVQASF